MQNKKYIKIISSVLIVITIFMFSVVLATDETAYVWSNQSKPITKQANAGLNTTETTAKIQNDLKMESGGAILIEQQDRKSVV